MKFAKWQHPAVGCGMMHDVFSTTYYVCIAMHSADMLIKGLRQLIQE